MVDRLDVECDVTHKHSLGGVVGEQDAVSVESRRINVSQWWQLPFTIIPGDWENLEVFGNSPFSFQSLLSQQACLYTVRYHARP